MADLAELVARFCSALHTAGIPVGADRAEWFTQAILLTRPASTRELYLCARPTLLLDPNQQSIFDGVFASVFSTVATEVAVSAATASEVAPFAGEAVAGAPGDGTPEGESERGEEGSGLERLGGHEFGDMTAEELAALADAMRKLTVATPPRKSRRRKASPHGDRVDLRATLRSAHRTGGDPLRLARHRPRTKPRRLVVLCDISGSMEPYARAMLQLLYCAAGGTKAEIFTFATRLTRLTTVLARARPAEALREAGQAAPDWSGGTRIGATLHEFINHYGRRGMARGAVLLIISDGWDTGDPRLLGQEMARLSRLAYRIVWVNPRTQSAHFRPLAGGMAAAWPFCDAVVSAHNLNALPELLAALRQH